MFQINQKLYGCVTIYDNDTQIAPWEDEWGRTADQWWKQHHNGQRKYPNKTAPLIQKSGIKHISSDYAQGYLKDSSVLLTSHITESQ